METAKMLGFCSHDTSTCGLYVHISRWNELLKFSRRTERNMARWSACIGYKKTSKEVKKRLRNVHFHLRF